MEKDQPDRFDRMALYAQRPNTFLVFLQMYIVHMRRYELVVVSKMQSAESWEGMNMDTRRLRLLVVQLILDPQNQISRCKTEWLSAIGYCT